MAMLTPGKIKGYQFQQAGRGTYRAEEVDDFLNQVVESYEQVFKENGELVKKLNILATKLNEYRKEEANISKALVNAQSFIDRMIEQANVESKKIVAEAEERAKNVDSITNAKIKVMVDEVEGKMRVAYDKAMAQAKQTKDDAYKESETLLLEAREKADITVSNAKATASVIIADATKEAEKEVDLLKIEIEKEKAVLDSLKETSNQFKTELVVLYERQLKSVEQMPEYKLAPELEETVKKIVEETKQEEKAEEDNKVEKIVEDFVSNDDDYFDADDLIREYADKDSSDDAVTALNFDYSDIEKEEETSEVKAEDFFNFDFNIDDVIKEDDTKAEENPFGTEEKEESVMESADEFEDIFSDSGDSESDSFRFTASDLEDISAAEKEEEAPFEFKTEDVDFFSEETAKEDIAISRPERKRKFDVAFTENDEIEIEKDEALFLNTEKQEATKEEGFKLFDNIDMSDDNSFDFESDDVVDTDDVFGNSDDDDDAEGFGFLRNIFGKKQ